MTSARLAFFPLDHQLELWQKHWSPAVVKTAVWLSGWVPSFERAEEVLRRVGQVAMSKTTIWRQVELWGERWQQVEQAEQEVAIAMPARGQVQPGVTPQPGQLGAALDGAMVHILQEGWKELKVGCVFDIEPKPVLDADSGEWVEVGHAVNLDYVAHLGGPERFGQVLWTAAQARGWERVYDTQVIGDGARWIWNLVGEHFSQSWQTVDWYHATSHLHQAAHLYHPDHDRAARHWYQTAETRLYQGHAAQIASLLRQAADDDPDHAPALHTEAHYFETHKRRMQYLEFREEGYLIGSGPVESGAKQFKARFTGPGMRWSRAGLERLLPIRAAILSDQFDDHWPAVYQNWPQN